MSAQGFNSQSQAFLEWFNSIPGSTFSDAIELVDLRSANAGRGIIATKDIEEDSVLFTIPRTHILSKQTSALRSKLPQVFDADQAPADPENGFAVKQDRWTSLILVMLYEYLQGDASSWKPYFDVLPESFNTPMFWSDAELDELQGSATRQRIGKEEAEEMFRTRIIPIVRQNASVFPRQEAVSDDQLVALAHRMGSLIMSYAFDLDKDDDSDEEDENEDGWQVDRDDELLMGMVPMADMLNADAVFNAVINHAADSLTATATRPIKEGEEILNFYGPLANSELLRRYGYVTEAHMRHDVVEISPEVIEAAVKAELQVDDSVLEKVRAKLEERELADEGAVIEWDTGAVEDDGTLLAQDLSRDSLEELNALLEAYLKYVEKYSQDRKRPREDAAISILRRIVHGFQAKYTTSLEEDQRLLGSLGAMDRRKMAVVVRMGEKTVLQKLQSVVMGAQSDQGPVEGSKRARTSN
ncbi:ribosomal n-lysine methyltransferase 4 [Emericellopsis cladophorae]|uniref:Ribosomal n-lysine methyltransferase 4 n=1 Tax=Emericellopsis cladophorae TaxID=2686198 RepID=A0A9P9Y7K1_9HYPO|nr:ribosomal n-lysine methyltransferase 4 [Emericellopsis cladophorae]KAI6784946.1 ribosomal n-lysine methyltransferase 4 [Emericellopsis cladophorae]